MGTLHEDQHTFVMVSRSVLPIIGNVSDNVVGKIKTHFMFSKLPPPQIVRL